MSMIYIESTRACIFELCFENYIFYYFSKLNNLYLNHIFQTRGQVNFIFYFFLFCCLHK